MIKMLPKFVKLAAIAVGGYFFFHTVSTIFIADVYAKLSRASTDAAEISSAMNYANKAIDLNANEPSYFRQRARVYVSMEGQNSKVMEKAIKQAAQFDLETAYRLNPNNLVTVRNLVPLYYYLALKDPLSPVLEAAQGNIDPEFLSAAKNYFDKVENISPNDVGVYALLEKYEKRLGLTEEYNLGILKIKKLRPDLLDWYLTE
jgi:hypothetical protein